jgi:hypothetical protein
MINIGKQKRRGEADKIETVKVWQITEFTELINKKMQEKYNEDRVSVHYNTADKWFKQLEYRHIHHIMRAAGEKVYDELDLRIGIFIFERRQEKWRLDVIFDNLPKFIEMRPFPQGHENDTSSLMPIDEVQLIKRISGKVEEKIITMISKQMETVEQKMNDQLHEMIHKELRGMLPEPVSEGEIKNQKNKEAMIKLQMEIDLEIEAIEKWSKLPEGERVKKVGFFKKEEDYIKRDQYIREYKQKKLKEE